MAAVGSAASLSAVSSLAPATRATKPRKVEVVVRKMSSFAGMRRDDHVGRLGRVQSTEHHFARVVAQCSAVASRTSRGGAAASTCNVASEIFRIVPIMSGLVLVGIALGFLLLRIEAAVEESE